MTLSKQIHMKAITNNKTELNFLQHVGDTWLHVKALSTAVAEQL